MPSAEQPIVFATIGSLGDLHPCLALALALHERGYRIALAATPWYRDRVEALGLEFRPLRPDWNPTDSALIRQCENLRRGPEVLFRRLILPHLADTYADLLAATADARLMIAGELVFAAPLVAEKRSLPWISAILSPTSFFSACDPSVLAPAPELIGLRRAGRIANRLALEIARLATRSWWKPVRELRRREGLRLDCEPVLRDKFSPHLVLALFSPALARPQPDWPPQTVQPGFVFHDGASTALSPELAAFLDNGDAPIVFTLGSTAVHHRDGFYETALSAARRVGRRALLVGAPASFAAPGVLAIPYAPYSQVFPRAAVNVHQGGSGTTGQALRAGRPMLVVPFGWDQPDNGARIARLGAGLCLARRSWTAHSAAHALARLLTDPKFSARAATLADQVASDQGLSDACDAIAALLDGRPG
jgi:rhamnosyltransferase subunit B